MNTRATIEDVLDSKIINTRNGSQVRLAIQVMMHHAQMHNTELWIQEGSKIFKALLENQPNAMRRATEWVQKVEKADHNIITAEDLDDLNMEALKKLYPTLPFV